MARDYSSQLGQQNRLTTTDVCKKDETHLKKMRMVTIIRKEKNTSHQWNRARQDINPKIVFQINSKNLPMLIVQDELFLNLIFTEMFIPSKPKGH